MSGLWLTTVAETDHGTVFKFLNGEHLRVEEGFDAVSEAFLRAER